MIIGVTGRSGLLGAWVSGVMGVVAGSYLGQLGGDPGAQGLTVEHWALVVEEWVEKVFSA